MEIGTGTKRQVIIDVACYSFHCSPSSPSVGRLWVLKFWEGLRRQTREAGRGTVTSA